MVVKLLSGYNLHPLFVLLNESGMHMHSEKKSKKNIPLLGMIFPFQLWNIIIFHPDFPLY
jgi:hypothetical protein